MNREIFRSAYAKLALSDECRQEMKAKLMEQMSRQDSLENNSSDDGELLHAAQEIKLPPKKRSPLKTAVITGSAAAVVLCTVGAGIFLRNNTLTQRPENTPATQEAQTTEAVTDEAYTDDEYYSKRCANGILHFQEFTQTTEEHIQPETLVEEEEFLDYLQENYRYIYYYMLGMDKDYAKKVERTREANEAIEGSDPEQADEMVASRPLGYELWLSESYISDSGIALVYRSEDGKKQVNLSVSDNPDEFLPITLPEGGYLVPVGEYRSSFTISGEIQFIEPEMFWLAAGSVTAGEDEFFSAVYAYEDSQHGMKYFRLDGKNITQEQFVKCIGTASDANISDHQGYYEDDGLNYHTFLDLTDDYIVPEATVVETEWGELRMNVITNGNSEWDGGFSYNVEYRDDYDTDVKDFSIPDEYRYTIDDIAEYSGIDIKTMIPDRLSTRKIEYKAKYDEIPPNRIQAKGWGANAEMLPGDDPRQFEESRDYIYGVYYPDDGEPDYDSACYMTDKIDYFNNKTRIGALYSVSCQSDNINESMEINVFDDWEMFRWNMTGLFARLPAVKTTGFAGVEDRFVYVCGGALSGSEYYIGGFKTENGRYLVLKTQNTGLKTFVETLVKLYTNSPDPEKLCEVEYPGRTYNITAAQYARKSTGRFYPNPIRLYDYTPNPEADYFTSVEEALKAAGKLDGKGAAILAEKWTIVPEKSAVTRYEDGEPAEISLYFTDGDRQLMAGIGYNGSDTLLRIPLPDGRRIEMAGQGAESSMHIGGILDSRHYLDNSSEIDAAIGGRVIEDVTYITAETYARDRVQHIDYKIDTVGLSMDEAIDVLCILVYQTDNVDFIGTPAVSDKLAVELLEVTIDDYYNIEGSGDICINQLSIYDLPEFSYDSGEQEISGEEAQTFLAENISPVELPFYPENITRRSRSADGGYSSEAVIFSAGDKSARLCVIKGGSAVSGYGEEYGVGTLAPYHSFMDSRKLENSAENPVAAYGTLPDGREVFFGIFIDRSTDIIYSVTTENLTLEEFADILAQAYLIGKAYDNME